MSNFQIVDDFEHGIPMTDDNMAQFGWVKVVRCRDCKYYIDSDLFYSPFCSFLNDHDTLPDGFCAWAERGAGE